MAPVDLLLLAQHEGRLALEEPASSDTVTRRRSDGRVDGVAVASRRVDAIFMMLKFRKLWKQTLSQHPL